MKLSLYYSSFPARQRCGVLVPTSRVAWSVCLFVCVSLFVGHIDVPCKNGRTDRDAVQRLSCAGRGTIIRWGRDHPRKGAIFVVSGQMEKMGVSAAVYAAKEIIQSSITA